MQNPKVKIYDVWHPIKNIKILKKQNNTTHIKGIEKIKKN